MGERVGSRFLSAYWKNLLMLNYEIGPEVLAPWLPAGLELDLWEGKALASVVGFRFEQTRVWGLAVPGYRDFEEVNLRFYVRRRVGGGWRRGVVFVRELVPRRMIAGVARCFYGECYAALPMASSFQTRESGRTTSMRYRWRVEGVWEELSAEARGEWKPLVSGSETEFIIDHAYGYSRRRGATVEYLVEHPPWRVREVGAAVLDADVARLYGPPFAAGLGQRPRSAFVAEGSPVTVRWGRRVA